MSDFDLTEIKALAWDVGGTVFDWHHSIKNEISKLAQDSSRNIDPAQFTNDWRTTMFELLQPVREGLESWKNADQLHLEALDIVLSKYDWPMTLKERAELNTIWHRLNAWPDAAENIEKLRSRYRVSYSQSCRGKSLSLHPNTMGFPGMELFRANSLTTINHTLRHTKKVPRYSV